VNKIKHLFDCCWDCCPKFSSEIKIIMEKFENKRLNCLDCQKINTKKLTLIFNFKSFDYELGCEECNKSLFQELEFEVLFFKLGNGYEQYPLNKYPSI
jgi:hypothetical protein